MFFSVVASALYFALEWFKSSIFSRLRRVADPSYSDDPEAFDFEAMGKWIVFEQCFDLLCILLLFLPGWLSSVSVVRNLLVLGLPKLRKKAKFVRLLYVSLERGYRAASTARAALEKNAVFAVSQGLCLACLVVDPSDHVLGFLLVRQSGALWQSLYTISGVEFLSRKVFTTVLNTGQLLLLLINLKLMSDPLFCVAVLVYVYQLTKPLMGFYLK